MTFRGLQDIGARYARKSKWPPRTFVDLDPPGPSECLLCDPRLTIHPIPKRFAEVDDGQDDWEDFSAPP